MFSHLFSPNILRFVVNIIKYMEFSEWYNKIKDPSIRAKRFIGRMKFRRFKRLLFVSKDAMKAYLELYPNNEKRCYVCHNVIDYKSIIDNSNNWHNWN